MSMTWPMKTEKATNWLDMPHAVKPGIHSRCICGRVLADEMHHDEVLPEIAADTATVLVTEKGS